MTAAEEATFVLCILPIVLSGILFLCLHGLIAIARRARRRAEPKDMPWLRSGNDHF